MYVPHVRFSSSVCVYVGLKWSEGKALLVTHGIKDGGISLARNLHPIMRKRRSQALSRLSRSCTTGCLTCDDVPILRVSHSLSTYSA